MGDEQNQQDGGWVDVGPVAELTFDPGACVTVNGLEIAIFRDGSAEQGSTEDHTYRAIDNSCPHAGGALSQGTQDGHQVTCPWHGWQFDVRTGSCLTLAEDSVRSYPVREAGGRLQLELGGGKALELVQQVF